MQYQRGKWYCSRRALFACRVGVGDTPKEAYLDWLSKTTFRG